MSDLLLLAQRGWLAESFVWLRLTKRVAICSVLFLFGYSLAAADFTGKIVRILDGDTIEVLHDNRAERIRLSGIDCPEKGQALGTRAKQAALELVFGMDDETR